MNAFGYLLALVASLAMNHRALEPALLAHAGTLASLHGPGIEESFTGPQLDPNVLYAFG